MTDAITKEARRQRRKQQSGRRTPPVTEERTLVIEAPAGSRRRGFEPFTVQDLLLVPQVIRFRRERWVTPDGQEIVAPLPPEVSGHFGPGIVRYVLMQHVQGQVTVERLRAKLRGLGVRISKGQIVSLLTANKDVFHAEKDAILEAGLASAAWVTVDGPQATPSGRYTAARHAGANEYTTHIGNDRFAWFATRPSKSRLNFLDLLRAGHPDYVINATALAYLVEHGVPESIVARGLLTDTVIVSDDAGQFDVFQHALCWIHAERHLRRIICVTDEQHRLVALQRQLVWWFYADLKLYKDDPTAIRRTALKQRFDRIFTRVTGFADLDEAIARTHANKDELLLVLDRPDIPLHTNGSENDVRSFVTKRKISGETRSAAGKQARDTFLSLLKTCSKLAISFWDYLGARLKIPDVDRVPWLPDLIRQNASA